MHFVYFVTRPTYSLKDSNSFLYIVQMTIKKNFLFIRRETIVQHSISFYTNTQTNEIEWSLWNCWTFHRRYLNDQHNFIAILIKMSAVYWLMTHTYKPQTPGVYSCYVFGGLFSYDKTEILLKVALNTITHNLTFLRTCKDGTKALCITHVRNKHRKRQQILNIIPLRD